LPNDSTHIVKANIFAELNNFFTNRNDLVTSIVNGTGKLVANVYTQPATVVKSAIALFPNQIQVVDVIFVAVVETNLVICSVVF